MFQDRGSGWEAGDPGDARGRGTAVPAEADALTIDACGQEWLSRYRSMISK
jgi:hypothetical protein